MTKDEFLADLGKKYLSIIGKFNLTDTFTDLVDRFNTENDYFKYRSALNDDPVIQGKFTDDFSVFFIDYYLYEQKKTLTFDWKNSVRDVFDILLGKFHSLEINDQVNTINFDGKTFNCRSEVNNVGEFIKNNAVNSYLADKLMVKLIEFDTKSDSYGFYVVNPAVEFTDEEKQLLEIKD